MILVGYLDYFTVGIALGCISALLGYGPHIIDRFYGRVFNTLFQ